MKNYFKYNWASTSITLIMLIFGIYLLPYLPERIHSHWDINGNPDGYSSKIFAVYCLPFISILLNLFLHYLTRFSPRKVKMENSKKSVNRIALSLTCFLMSIYIGMLLTAYDPITYRFETFFHFGTGLFLIIAGNYMSKVEKNYFIGIRTPWTLTSEKNWNATHRFAAKCMVIAGFIILLSSFRENAMAYNVIIFITALLIPVGYSLWFFLSKERTQEAKTES